MMVEPEASQAIKECKERMLLVNNNSLKLIWEAGQPCGALPRVQSRRPLSHFKINSQGIHALVTSLRYFRVS